MQLQTEFLDLRLCDNMQLMAQYPDKHFELAIVDPPYGNESSYNNRRKLKSYKNQEPASQYYKELFRVSKNQIIWGANYLRNYDLKGGGIVWNKLGTHTEHRKQAPSIGDCEFAYSSFHNNIKMFSYGWMGNVLGNNYQINPPESKDRFHPSQKPVALYKWLLDNYAKEGDKILDTHLGSGSIAIACHDYKYHLTACELDSDYFAAMQKRVENHLKQTILF